MKMKIKKFYIFVFIYFFINNFGLPHGLLYTTILFPVFYIFLIYSRQKLVLTRFFIFVIPFMCIHLLLGVEIYFYFRSLIIFMSVYIFMYASYVCIKHYRNWEKVFDWVLRVNVIFTVIALVFLFTPLIDVFWAGWWISRSVGFVPRLKMLTYEPSYYSTLLIPLIIFYNLKLFYHPKKQSNWLNVIALIIPLVLSFSVGVMGAVAITFGIFFCINIIRGFRKSNIFKSYIIIFVLIFLGFFALLIVYPNNPLYLRLYDIITLHDSSGSGRTIDSVLIAHKIVSLKSIWFGVGFGQVKVLGIDIVREFYSIPVELYDYFSATIPNTVAETYAVFGITGLIIRFTLIFYFFYKGKVWRNHYQLLMFIYVFVYQFTGSFYVNIAEYMIWIFAFVHCFPQFDYKRSRINFNDSN